MYAESVVNKSSCTVVQNAERYNAVAAEVPLVAPSSATFGNEGGKLEEVDKKSLLVFSLSDPLDLCYFVYSSPSICGTFSRCKK